MDMPYFAIVYAENETTYVITAQMHDGMLAGRLLWLPVWFLNQMGLRLSGGARFRMCGLRLFSR